MRIYRLTTINVLLNFDNNAASEEYPRVCSATLDQANYSDCSSSGDASTSATCRCLSPGCERRAVRRHTGREGIPGDTSSSPTGTPRRFGWGSREERRARLCAANEAKEADVELSAAGRVLRAG